MNKLFHLCTALVLCLLLQGCATVDFDYPKNTIVAPVDTAHTYLGQQMEGVEEQHPGEGRVLSPH